MRFVITGTGRTGTMFLANALARSRRVIVRHEHADDHVGWFAKRGSYDHKRHLALVRQRFELHDDYGEVNSFLRYLVENLTCLTHRAVIIRNPAEVLLSSINKTPRRWFAGAGFADRAGALDDDLHEIDRLIATGLRVIRFEEITRDVEKLAQVIDWLGLLDVNPEEVNLSIKLNSASRNIITRLSSLTAQQRQETRRVRWFANKHYPGTWEI